MVAKLGVKKKCMEGTPCGNTCIQKGLRCVDDIPPEIARQAVVLVAAITGESKRKKGRGAGSATLSEREVNTLLVNQEFLRSASPEQIVERARTRGLAELSAEGDPYTPEDLTSLTDAVWQLIPSSTRKHLIAKGSLGDGDIYMLVEGGHGKKSEGRAKFILQRFIEQNGRDAYTGEPISLTGSDLEHIEPFGANGAKAERSGNMVFVSTSVNQRKGESSLGGFLDNHVVPIAEAAKKDPEYWGRLASKASARQADKDAIDDLLKGKSPNSWTDGDVDRLGKKYYYVGRALGHLTAYTKTRPRGFSGESFSLEIGIPLTKAFARAYGSGDTDRVAELESVRQQLVVTAGAESAVKKGNAGGRGGPMHNLFLELRGRHNF